MDSRRESRAAQDSAIPTDCVFVYLETIYRKRNKSDIRQNGKEGRKSRKRNRNENKQDAAILTYTAKDYRKRDEKRWNGRKMKTKERQIKTRDRERERNDRIGKKIDKTPPFQPTIKKIIIQGKE